MAKALARAGCAVSIWGRNPEKNRAAIAELAPCGAPVEARSARPIYRTHWLPRSPPNDKGA